MKQPTAAEIAKRRCELDGKPCVGAIELDMPNGAGWIALCEKHYNMVLKTGTIDGLLAEFVRQVK